ncbi:MAG: hypothetical protein Q8R28_15175 [Dehalococcoidia bacterium]|nr:hypothetical protein [Dehalococcoidia bacterium]
MSVMYRCSLCGDVNAMGGVPCPIGGVHRVAEYEVDDTKVYATAANLNADEMVEVVFKFLNGTTNSRLLEQALRARLPYQHRTHQQLFMKAVLAPGVEEMARHGQDGRNEASVELAQAWVAAKAPPYYFPFV